jgi:hypothetical protein
VIAPAMAQDMTHWSGYEKTYDPHSTPDVDNLSAMSGNEKIYDPHSTPVNLLVLEATANSDFVSWGAPAACALQNLLGFCARR